MFYVAGICTLSREKRPSSGVETMCGTEHEVGDLDFNLKDMGRH